MLDLVFKQHFAAHSVEKRIMNKFILSDAVKEEIKLDLVL